MTTTRQKKPSVPSPIHSTSSPSVKLSWLNLDEVKARLIIAARKLAKRHSEIDEVWLFGSLAGRQAVPGSDADVFLVLQDCDLPFLERAAHYQPEFCGLGVDLFAIPVKSWSRWKRPGINFWKEPRRRGFIFLGARKVERGY